MTFEIKKIISTLKPFSKLQPTHTLLGRLTNSKGKFRKKIMNFHSWGSVTPETKIESSHSNKSCQEKKKEFWNYKPEKESF